MSDEMIAPAVAMVTGIAIGTVFALLELWWRNRKRRAAQRDGRTERGAGRDRSGAASATGK